MVPAIEPTADTPSGVYVTLPKSTEPVESSIFAVAASAAAARLVDGVRLIGAASVEQASTNVVANRAVLTRLRENKMTILVRGSNAGSSSLGGKRRAIVRRPSR